MRSSNKKQNHARHCVVLILALIGLISAATLLLGPARLVSAQAVAATWTITGNLNTGRVSHSATLLPNGKVLVAGGANCLPCLELNSAELYDPATGTWSITGNLNTARINHTATLLANGKVLVAGGYRNVFDRSSLNSAELYDPATGTWTNTGNLNAARDGHTATLLPNGKVLVAGGGYYTNKRIYPGNSAELYDPATGTWSTTGSLNAARWSYTATLLPNGKVLVAGGLGGDYSANHPAELFDPATGIWSTTGSLNSDRFSHSATLLPNGKVLVVGGQDTSSGAELYDPATGIWSTTGNLNKSRYPLAATLLPNGKVLVAGGADDCNEDFCIFDRSAELYDPDVGTWSYTGNLNTAHTGHTSTLLPSGRVLVAGGSFYDGQDNAELYDPGTNPTATPTPTPTPTPTATPTPTPTPTSTPAVGPTWTITGNLNTGRDSQTATLLQNGKVLVAGGNDSNGTLKTAELYDPVTGTWSVTGSLNTARAFHTATLLSNGKVLVAGGFKCTQQEGCPGQLNSAELYDPATGTWNNTGNLNGTFGNGRSSHTATLLPNGKVLVAGGSIDVVFCPCVTGTAELYDPATGTWSSVGNLNTGRSNHTATLLQNGKVLVAGGDNWGNNSVKGEEMTTELYDAATGTWSMTGSLNTARQLHSATLLSNGKVLAAAGFTDFNAAQVTNTAELYDPGTGTWTTTGNLNKGRAYHTATSLVGSKILVAGGFFVDNFPNITKVAELYDPATETWSITATLNIARRFHTATLLQNGKVLAAGGSGFNAANSAELYDPGNPIDDGAFFITQQYRDFLRRLPEPGPDGIYGTPDDPLQFYLNILNGCNPADIECAKYTRGALSANFFRSPEFQRKGSFVMYLYMVSLGQRPVTVADLSDPAKIDRPHFAEFMADLESISTPNDDPALTETKKNNLANAWMHRAEIQQKYGSLSNAAFVQTLLDTAGVTISNQSTLVQDLNNGSKTRAQVLRAIVESPEVNAKFYKAAFVTMEYFGYLRRDPEDCHGSPDPSQCGYIFHNNRFQLVADPDFLENTIVRGFIESPEYRQRFGP